MKLSELDVRTLANYHFDRELLCVTKAGLGVVERKDVTRWEVIKSFFGFGKLVGCDIRLTSISRYLAERDLSHLSQEHPAYRTVHAIATRMLVHKKEGNHVPILWQKLATKTHELSITFYAKRHARDFKRRIVVKERALSVRKRLFFLTPLTTVGHLKAQAELEARERSWKKTPLAACSVGGLGLIDASTPVDAKLLTGILFRVKVSNEYAPGFSNYWHTHPRLFGAPMRVSHRF